MTSLTRNQAAGGVDHRGVADVAGMHRREKQGSNNKHDECHKKYSVSQCYRVVALFLSIMNYL